MIFFLSAANIYIYEILGVSPHLYKVIVSVIDITIILNKNTFPFTTFVKKNISYKYCNVPLISEL